jgi:hypothetical protein
VRLDPRTRRRLRLDDVVFILLLAALTGLLAWLTSTWRYEADWTATGRNTLSQSSREVVRLLEGPVQATAFVPEDPLQREGIRDLVDRYRRAGAPVELRFVNPETNPGLARELGIRGGGEVILRHEGREQRLQRLSEQSVTNALARLARSEPRWIVFLTGHGERDPNAEGNADLDRFAGRLREAGLRVQTHRLATMPHIPDNTDLVVISSPQSAYLPGERALVRQYVRDGGHLLWLTEPDGGAGLEGLASDLGLRVRPGVVVDPAASRYGAERPDFTVVGRYGGHPVTEGLDRVTLFPQAAALESGDGQGWRHTDLLLTRDASWLETGPIEGGVERGDAPGEPSGPLSVGIAGTRGAAGGEGQRIAVIGDGDFLSNAYLGNGGNLDLGMRLMHWLVGEDERVQIAPTRPGDIELDLSETALAIVGLGFLVGLPGGLLAVAGWIAWRRRHR